MADEFYPVEGEGLEDAGGGQVPRRKRKLADKLRMKAGRGQSPVAENEA